MSKIIQLYSDKNKKIKAYPKTLASEVYMDNGTTNISTEVDNRFKEVNSQLDNIVEHCTGGNGMQEHSHVNKNVIDKISTDVDGNMTFDGKPIIGGGSGANINDNELSSESTWSSDKISTWSMEQDGITWTEKTGDFLTIDNCYEYKLKDIEIFGNTIQDENNLEDIQSVGELYVDEKGNPILDGEGKEQYKIDILSSNSTDTSSPNYSENKTTILLPCQLQKIGDVEDGLYWDSVKSKYVEKKSIKTIKANSITWKLTSNEYENTIMFQTTIPDKVPGNFNIMSDIAVTNSVYSSDEEGVFGGSSHSWVFARVSKKNVTNIDEFNNYIQDKYIYYQSSTITTIETNITEKIKVPTYASKTHVFCDGTVSGTIKCKAPIKTSSALLSLEDSTQSNKLYIETLNETSYDLINVQWDTDFRLCEVEWALEDSGILVPVSTMFNTKLGGNIMALSRYEQAKIIILGGKYDRETLTKQLTRYLERGYLTQSEYDELIAMMDAKDLIKGE